MNNWLKEPVVEIPCNNYNGHNHPSFYYTEKELIKVEYNLIGKNTRYNDINLLFSQLVDYCIDHNILNTDGTPVLNPNIKRPFLKFVYIHSKHKK
jgi:hypothetical protein